MVFITQGDRIPFYRTVNIYSRPKMTPFGPSVSKRTENVYETTKTIKYPDSNSGLITTVNRVKQTIYIFDSV